MSKKEKQILETFGKIIPDLTEIEKEKLLSYGEGYADGIRTRKGVLIACTDGQSSMPV